MFRRITVISVVFLAIVGLYACVQPPQDASAPPSQQQAAAQTAAKPEAPAPQAASKPAEPSKPEPASVPKEPPKPELKKELVRNGDFMLWENGKPVGWSVGNCEEITGGNNAKAIALRPMDDPGAWNVLQQKLAEPVQRGTPMRVSAEIRADNPEMAILKVVWWSKEGEQFKEKVQTEAGALVPVTMDIVLPEDAGNVVKVQVLRKPNVTGELLVSNVSVKVPE